MADNIGITEGSGRIAAADEIAGALHQRVKVQYGVDGSATDVSTSTPLPVELTDNSNTVVSDIGEIKTAVQVIDNAIAGSEIQADVVTLPDVDINDISKGTQTNDIKVTLDGEAVSTELTTADLDTGAGTDTRAVVGLVGTASGGGELIPGSATDGLLVNLGANNDISGTVTANLSATDNAVLDSIDTNSTTIAGAVSGSEMQVDVVGALPAGTNAIGKLAANSGVDIGDVDVTTLPSDTFVAEEGALGKGVLLQGDDGTDRKNINVDATTGDVQVDVTNTVTVDGSGVTQPVSGTVTANLSATDNAVLDNIDADTTSIKTAVELIDDAVYTDGSGTPSKGILAMGTDGTNPQAIAVDASGNVQVDIVSGSSAGTEYTEGDTDASITGVATMWEDTSDTLVATSAAKPLPVAIISGAGSGGTASDDDADFTAGATSGTPAMGVYESTPSSVTDGDMGIAGITATRQLRTSSTQEGTWDITNISGTVSLPTGAATAANQQTDALTDTELRATPVVVDLGANNDVTVTGTVTANLGATDNAVLDTIETNTDFGTVTGGGIETGALRVTIANNSTGVVSVDDNGGSITVDGTVTANLSATDNAVLDAIEADTTTIAGDTTSIDGKITACNTGAVTISSALPAGTNAIGKLAANSGVDIGDVDVTSITGVTMSNAGMQITGDEAHDAVDAGNPIKIGAKAETDMTGITAVADGDRTDVYAGSDGILLVRQDAPLGNVVSGNASNTDGASTACIAAQGANIKTYLTDFTLTNTSATDIYVEIKDGTTAKWTVPVPAGGGITHSFRTPLAGTANTAWNFDASAATTTLYCSMSGFKSKI